MVLGVTGNGGIRIDIGLAVFYREKVGIEETKEILVTYLQRKDRNLNRLLKYAELMKCDKTMRQYLEVLV